MIPSKRLRKIISRNMEINLEALAWSKDLERKILKIEFVEKKSTTKLETIFKNGYNIGNCLLTANYVATIFENVSICSGKTEILKGTKNAENGDHVWLETDDYIIDTTLMIILPKNNKIAKLYLKDYNIIPNFSPEEMNYEDEYYYLKRHPTEYYFNLFYIKGGLQ